MGWRVIKNQNVRDAELTKSCMTKLKTMSLEMTDEKKKIRELRIALAIMMVGFISMLVFVVYLVLTEGGSAPGYYENTEIEYISLTDSQIQKSKEIIKELKPLYLHFAKSITIVEDMEIFCNTKRIYCSATCSNGGCGGFYRGGDIFVGYLS